MVRAFLRPFLIFSTTLVLCYLHLRKKNAMLSTMTNVIEVSFHGMYICQEGLVAEKPRKVIKVTCCLVLLISFWHSVEE